MTVALKGFETFTGTDTPVVGATVYAIVASDSHPNGGAVAASTTTASNGMWSFAALADATYDVKVTYNSRIKWRKGNEKFSNAIAGSNFAAAAVNTIFGGPSSGGSATPTFRSLVNADLATSIIQTANLNPNATAQSWLAIGATPGVTTSSTSYTIVDGLQISGVTPATALSEFIMIHVGTYSLSVASNPIYTAFQIDSGANFGESIVSSPAIGLALNIVNIYRVAGLSVAAHTFQIRWRVDTGTATALAVNRSFILVEIKR